MSADPRATELVSLRSALASTQADLATLAAAGEIDRERAAAVRANVLGIVSRSAPLVGERPTDPIRRVVADLFSTKTDVTRISALLSDLDARLALQEQVHAYHRSSIRAIGAVVLWIIAALAAVVGVLAALLSMAIGQPWQPQLTFWLLPAAAFVALGVALWRRGDPRPRRLSGRVLVVAASLCIVVSLVSTSVLERGASLPVIAADQRYEVSGVASVVAPGVQGWKAQRSSGPPIEQVAFSRDVGRRDRPENNETVRAELSANPVSGDPLPARDLIKQGLDAREDETDGGRLVGLSFSTSAVSGRDQCTRYDHVTRDTGVPQFPGSAFTLTSHGIYCVDPDAAFLIHAQWSHRYLEGTQPEVADSDADTFLSSLRVTRSPSATARPAAIPSPGTVVFAERFNDRTTGWTVTDNEFARVGYLSDSAYGIELRKTNSHAHVATQASGRRRDAYIEADIGVGRATNTEYGPTCRVDDKFQSFYYFAVASDGASAIYRVEGRETKTLAVSPGILRSLRPPAAFKVATRCYGEKGAVALALSVNGTVLLRAEDRDGAIDRDGWSGFYVGGGPTPILRLTSFTVRELAR